ncbi:twin-arginine translocation signal domain-containing protein [Faecalibacterium prausnitzii]|uniref:twin-arginine translocation signal domain-containing protein n=1 Tax=Faecalibacterium prausnitzii TaxID=853 RepID=UPI001F2E9810|nr:twin-arginine translocation signal domain-containing protein [Faecalibacterium prausnitzii]
MKELNRRAFLTLSGAAVVALSLAGCGGGPSVPPAPAAPTQKELDLLKALNQMLEDYWKDQGYPEKIRTLSYNQDASDFARHFVSPCVKADKAEVEMTPEQIAAFEKEMTERLQTLRNKYGSDVAMREGVMGCRYVLGDPRFNEMKLTIPYELSGENFKDTFLKMVNGMNIETRDLGIYCPTVAGTDYIVIAHLTDMRQ